MTTSAPLVFSIPPECWHNIAEAREDHGAMRLTRVPFALPLSEKSHQRAACPAGAELRFRLKSPEARIVLRRSSDGVPSHELPGAALVGVFHGDYQAGWYGLGEGDTAIPIKPPNRADRLPHSRKRFDWRLVRVVLPTFPVTLVVSFEGEIEPPQPGDVPALNYLAYGSSITHGAFTPLGNCTYPAVIARELGMDVANLGLAGQAHLEPGMADWLAARQDWDFASLELGVNLLSRLSVDEFRAHVQRFLQPFAADPRRRPVVCLDILRHGVEFCGEKNTNADNFRRVVVEEVAALASPHIFHQPFDAIQDLTDLADDTIHPAHTTFENIGRHFAARFRTIPAVSALLQHPS